MCLLFFLHFFFLIRTSACHCSSAAVLNICFCNLHINNVAPELTYPRVKGGNIAVNTVLCIQDVITWLVYSPHCAPPPLRWVVVFRMSALASGSNTIRKQRAEHTLQLGGPLWYRRGISAAAALLFPSCFVSDQGNRTWECVLHHVRLCCFSLSKKEKRHLLDNQPHWTSLSILW